MCSSFFLPLLFPHSHSFVSSIGSSQHHWAQDLAFVYFISFIFSFPKSQVHWKTFDCTDTQWRPNQTINCSCSSSLLDRDWCKFNLLLSGTFTLPLGLLMRKPLVERGRSFFLPVFAPLLVCKKTQASPVLRLQTASELVVMGHRKVSTNLGEMLPPIGKSTSSAISQLLLCVFDWGAVLLLM